MGITQFKEICEAEPAKATGGSRKIMYNHLRIILLTTFYKVIKFNRLVTIIKRRTQMLRPKVI